MADKCEAHSGLVSDVKNLYASDKKQWDAIERLQNRLPIWATLVISVLSAISTWALTYASFAMGKTG